MEVGVVLLDFSGSIALRPYTTNWGLGTRQSVDLDQKVVVAKEKNANLFSFPVGFLQIGDLLFVGHKKPFEIVLRISAVGNHQQNGVILGVGLMDVGNL